MLKKRRWVHLLLVVALLGSVDQAFSAAHSWAGGTCYVYRNGQLTWDGWEDDYYFYYSGKVQFFVNGYWRVLYYDGPDWADSPGVYCNSALSGFTLELEAKNLTDDVSLPYVSGGSVAVMLNDGGGIPSGVQVNAPQL